MTHSHTNDTSDYQLVGNKSTVISSHATREETLKAMGDACPDGYIDNSPWGTLDVVAPGQSVTGEFQEGLTEEQLANPSPSWPW